MPKQILIVEDESIVALDIRQRLGHLGYAVTGVAATGEDAIRKARTLRPDLVLMDITLKGGMDGIDAAQQIDRSLSIPVIFLTAHSDPATLSRAKLTEPYGYVLKPFEDRELSVAIEMGLYKHSKVRERTEFDLARIEDLRNQALRDSLTGLYNRRHLEEELAREIARAGRANRPFSLAALDIDHFKSVNDTFGHLAGDALLRAIAQLMVRLFRTEDLVCRMGGDELLIAMPETAINGATFAVNRLQSRLRELRVSYQNVVLPQVTLSIGIAAFPEHATTAETLARQADVALYRAKSNGRNQVVTADNCKHASI